MKARLRSRLDHLLAGAVVDHERQWGRRLGTDLHPLPGGRSEQLGGHGLDPIHRHAPGGRARARAHVHARHAAGAVRARRCGRASTRGRSGSFPRWRNPRAAIANSGDRRGTPSRTAESMASKHRGRLLGEMVSFRRSGPSGRRGPDQPLPIQVSFVGPPQPATAILRACVGASPGGAPEPVARTAPARTSCRRAGRTAGPRWGRSRHPGRSRRSPARRPSRARFRTTAATRNASAASRARPRARSRASITARMIAITSAVAFGSVG